MVSRATAGAISAMASAIRSSPSKPFIAADAEVPLEPNMVLAYEIPFYINGVGAFNLEDQILITERGHESMNHLPRGLVQVG